MRTLLARRSSYILPSITLVVAWWVMLTPTFRGSASVFAVLEAFGLLGLVALGLGVSMIAGELDLSVGSVAALAAVVAIVTAPLGLVPAILAAVTAGMTIGLVQGAVIAWLGINSLVLTIGTLILIRGLTFVFSGNAPLPLSDFTVSDPLLKRYGVFSITSIVALAVFVGLGLFLAYTRPGRQIYAIGGARREALTAGVSKFKPLTIAFVISAGCSSLAGALAAIRGGSAAPNNYADLLLAGAAAALLGGISLYGGRGTVLNVGLGVAIIGLIRAGSAARGYDAATTELITGALLLFFISIEFAAARFKLPRLLSVGPSGNRMEGVARNGVGSR